jgi:hypothetical protein
MYPSTDDSGFQRSNAFLLRWLFTQVLSVPAMLLRWSFTTWYRIIWLQRSDVILQNITHPSTDRAQCCLSSVTGQDHRSQRATAGHLKGILEYNCVPFGWWRVSKAEFAQKRYRNVLKLFSLYFNVYFLVSTTCKTQLFCCAMFNRINCVIAYLIAQIFRWDMSHYRPRN